VLVRKGIYSPIFIVARQNTRCIPLPLVRRS
jgi:hypothetical protein